jgi:hypothetical protein
VDKPSIGRVVHYVISKEVHLPATITSVKNSEEEIVNLFLMNDPEIPRRYDLEKGVVNCRHDEEANPGTWHWPERV